ncbi:F-box/LRR-repeat protein 14 [Dichanthelium oligosanthes]|uniref:RING-type E3 ubiquitin transferase n=1 Tax=Dichanthelium oligosanthes TaxID=888268 RepID=A0A1E5UUU5_9POAL|nr:F-box/LRR-repeat protein 14 [Dichanthelium oligosanthes]
MEDLPEALLGEIIKRLPTTSDLNSISLVSKRLYTVEAELRDAIYVGCGICPVTVALASLCSRFQNLCKVEFNYSGWTPNHGMQLDNQGLHVFSSCCPSLTDLTLSFCSYIDNSGLGFLACFKKLMTLRLKALPEITSIGLLSVAVGCKSLSALRLISCKSVGSVEWLEYLGKIGSLEELVVENCCQSRYDFCCDYLTDFTLAQITTEAEIGLCCLLRKCKALENLFLYYVLGVHDNDMITLAHYNRNLRSISLMLTPQHCEGDFDNFLFMLQKKVWIGFKFELSRGQALKICKSLVSVEPGTDRIPKAIQVALLTTREVFVKASTFRHTNLINHQQLSTLHFSSREVQSCLKRNSGSVPAYAIRDGIRNPPAELGSRPSDAILRFQFGSMQLAVSPDSLLFFCSVTASVAAAFALISLYRHLAHRRAQPTAEDLDLAASSAAAEAGGDDSEELLPLSAAAAGVPPFMYNRLVRHSGKGAGWTDCAVCLGVIQVGAMVKLLPACSHVYHRDCIDLWLSSRSTCPLCRCRVGDAAPAPGQEPSRQLAQPSSVPQHR